MLMVSGWLTRSTYRPAWFLAAEVPDGPILQFTRAEIAAMIDGGQERRIRRPPVARQVPDLNRGP
jgi:hypothetical protein